MADETNANMASLGDLSDQDIMIKFCLDNKVSKTAIDELLKRGYDSLAALRLVNIEDLSSQNIPMGQRRLIIHIAQAWAQKTQLPVRPEVTVQRQQRHRETPGFP